MLQSLITAAVLIINFVFDAYIIILMLRLLLQKMGAHWYNPFTQFVIKFTEPVVKPLRRFIPGYKGFDLAIIVIMFVLEIIELWLTIWLKLNIFPGILGTIIIAVGELGSKLVNIYFYAVIIGAIISWFPSLQRNPITEIIDLLTWPLSRIARRITPTVAGFDLSPILIIIVLLLINILVFAPIVSWGMRLVLGG